MVPNRILKFLWKITAAPINCLAVHSLALARSPVFNSVEFKWVGGGGERETMHKICGKIPTACKNSSASLAG